LTAISFAARLCKPDETTPDGEQFILSGISTRRQSSEERAAVLEHGGEVISA